MSRKIGRVKLPAAARRIARAALRARASKPASERFGEPHSVYVARRIAASQTIDGDQALGFLRMTLPKYRAELARGNRSPSSSDLVGVFFLWGGEPARVALEKMLTSRPRSRR